MKDGHELKAELRQYIGCEQPFRHGLVSNFLYTDGVQFFLRNAGNGAYWLLDILATEPKIRRHVQQDGFALVTLKVIGSVATLVVDNGNTGDNQEVVYSRTIGFTDCPECPVTDDNPEGYWKFYIEGCMVNSSTTGSMMMLPSER